MLRDGFQPNTSVGRFWRLYLRNVAGFLPHKNDKATFGNTWRVVLAENEDVLGAIGWEPNSVEMGFKAGDDTVTISRFTGGNLIASVSGSTPEEMLPYLADSLARQVSWQMTFTVGVAPGDVAPAGPALAHPRANDRPRRLVEARREAISVRARAHERVAARAAAARLVPEADVESLRRGRSGDGYHATSPNPATRTAWSRSSPSPPTS